MEKSTEQIGQKQQKATEQERAHYMALLENCHLTFMEIAQKVGVTDTTVRGVLHARATQHYSIETERRIFREIDRRVDAMIEGLNRLRGFAS